MYLSSVHAVAKLSNRLPHIIYREGPYPQPGCLSNQRHKSESNENLRTNATDPMWLEIVSFIAVLSCAVFFFAFILVCARTMDDFLRDQAEWKKLNMYGLKKPTFAEFKRAKDIFRCSTEIWKRERAIYEPVAFARMKRQQKVERAMIAIIMVFLLAAMYCLGHYFGNKSAVVTTDIAIHRAGA